MMTEANRYGPLHRLIQAIATLTILLAGQGTASADCDPFGGHSTNDDSSFPWILTSEDYYSSASEGGTHFGWYQGWFSGSIPPGLTIGRSSTVPFYPGSIQFMEGRVAKPGKYRYEMHRYAEFWHYADPFRSITCLYGTRTHNTHFELQVFPDFTPDGVEISQAIQEVKSPDDLYRWLSSTPPEPLQIGDMPVPLVEDKAGMLRIFFKQIETPVRARVRITALSAADESVNDTTDIYTASQDVTVLPGCSPRESRLHLQGSGHRCHSVDFHVDATQFQEGSYRLLIQVGILVPDSELLHPAGWYVYPNPNPCQAGAGSRRGRDWYGPDGSTLIQTSLDASPGTVEAWSCLFPSFKVNKTDTIVIHPVSVCHDSTDVLNGCGDAIAMSRMSRLLANLAPTSKVKISGGEVPHDFPLQPGQNADDWWDKLSRSLEREERRLPLDQPGTHHVLWGVVHPNAPGNSGGIAGKFTRSAASRSSVIRMQPNDVETSDGVVAHEFGHTVGLDHTGTPYPAYAAPPGCYGAGAISGEGSGWIQWPYGPVPGEIWSSNQLFSGPRADQTLQVGLEVNRNRAVGSDFGEPDLMNFEMMSYCTPRWVTPWSYLALYEALTGPSDVIPLAPLAELQACREVSGSLIETGVSFDPVFTFDAITSLDPGTGSHRMELVAADGSVLYTKWFTPRSARTETAGSDIVTRPHFSVLVPDLPGVASIVVFDAGGDTVGVLPLGGTAPTVQIVNPSGGGMLQGLQSVTWNVVDPDSQSHTFFVEYSPDAGNTWNTLTNSHETVNLMVNFDRLPGADGTGLIRVHGSDGVNTGEATSEPFTVEKKTPAANIIDPKDGAVLHVGEVLTLDGSGFDADDGVLNGSALTWSSPSLGSLGTDARVNLGEIDDRYLGNHTIVLTALDADGNPATATVTLTVEPKTAVTYPVTPPVVNAGGPYRGEEGSPVTFSSSGSFASDLTPLIFAWDFGDGGTSTDSDPSHTFVDDGDYLVQLTATDQRGQTITETTNAQISGIAPVVTAGLLATGPSTRPVAISASFDAAGLDDGPWTVSWNFGDGASATPITVYAEGPLTISHVYDTAGAYIADVAVEDEGGARGFATIPVAVGLLGDVDNEGGVNCTDVSIVRASFGKRTGQSGFDARADINTDGIVDVRDLYFVASRLSSGTQCPTSP